MGGCLRKQRSKSAATPTLATDPCKLDSDPNVTVPDREHIADLQRVYLASSGRMHRRVKDCYDCVLARRNECVTDLNLKFVNLGAEGMMHLAIALPHFPKLVALRLWKTRFGSDGAGYLSTALYSLPGLRLLSIEDNEIRAPGLFKLSEAIRSLTHLEELFLHLNKLGPEGGFTLSVIVSNLRKLRSVTSDENSIQDHAAEELVASLARSARSLELLGLSFNRLTDFSVVTLHKLLPAFPHLKRVTLNGNALSEQIRGELSAAAPNATFLF